MHQDWKKVKAANARHRTLLINKRCVMNQCWMFMNVTSYIITIIWKIQWAQSRDNGCEKQSNSWRIYCNHCRKKMTCSTEINVRNGGNINYSKWDNDFEQGTGFTYYGKMLTVGKARDYIIGQRVCMLTVIIKIQYMCNVPTC